MEDKMKKILIALFVTLILTFSSCENSTDPGERTGAVCKDGTTSSATGSGACSHHGGVDHWTYK